MNENLKVKNEQDLTEYKVTFVGVTINEAQAIEGAIQAISELKAKDELPLAKYKKEFEETNVDLMLFKDIYTIISENAPDANLLKRIESRIEILQPKINELELKIENHQDNISYINNYIIKIRKHIKEDIDTENHIVTYTYDMTYIEGFLDLASIIFEIDFHDEKVN